MYSILSGVAHSDYGVLSQLAFSKSYNHQSDKVIANPTIPIELQKMLLENMASFYTRGAWLRTIQFGCDTAQIAISLEERYDDLNLADTNEVRFWRIKV